jgi:hypothetical protein
MMNDKIAFIFVCVAGAIAPAVFGQTEEQALTEEQQILKAQTAQAAGDYQVAMQSYQKLSDKGVDIAHFTLGFFYEQGLGTNVSLPKACQYYQKAAESKTPLALEKMGDCYLNGVFGEQNITDGNKTLSTTTDDSGLSTAQRTAVDYYLQAQQSGILSASCKAGSVLLENGSSEQKTLGLSYCDQAAQMGSPTAAYQLGTWYLNGTLVKTDYAKAQLYLQMAKPEAHPPAAFALAQVYDYSSTLNVQGKELTKTALFWYETAASQGFTAAYLPSSLLYWKLSEHDNNPELLAKSYLWLKTASAVQKSLDEDIKAFTKAVNATVPDEWKATLDAKVQKHLQTFHK